MATVSPCPVRKTLLAGLLALGACQTTGQVVDQLPEFVQRKQLNSTVWIGLSKDNKNINSMASAIIVDSNLLLTNGHVWAVKGTDTPWWQSELPSTRSLFLANPELRELRNASGTVSRRIKPLVRRQFRLLAAGTESFTAAELATAKGEIPDRLWAKDWALIQTDQPTWNPQDAAIIHANAYSPTWAPRLRTDTLIAGFSSLFLDDDGEPGEKRKQPKITDLARFILHGPYVLAGDVRFINEQPGITYRDNWPRPGGHSGGGVYLLNPRSQRPELIGIFHSHVPVRESNTLFGVTLSTGRHWYLCYSPIGEVAGALRKHSRIQIDPADTPDEDVGPHAPVHQLPAR